MKKIVCLLTALLLCTSLIMPAMAYSMEIYVPSIGPVIEKAVVDGVDVTDCLIITTIPTARDKSTPIDQKTRDKMQVIYTDLSNGSEELPGVSDMEQNYLDFSDIHFSEACTVHEDHEELLAKIKGDDTFLELTLKLPIEFTGDVIAYEHLDEGWVQLDCTADLESQTLNIILHDLEPMVFLELGSGEGEENKEDVEDSSVTNTQTPSRFVPSVTYKGNPDIVSVYSNMDLGGAEGEGELERCLVITSVMQAQNKETDISQDERDLLLDLFYDLVHGDSTLPIEKNHVIRELMDISFLFMDCYQDPQHGGKDANLKEDGVTLTVVLELDVDDEVPMIMSYIDGKWEPIVSVEKNDDGTFTCVFEDIGPIAVATSGDPDAENPYLGDPTVGKMGIWVATMVICAAGIVVLTVAMKKKRK